MNASPIRVLIIADSEREVRRLHGAVAGRSSSHFEITHAAQVSDALRRMTEHKFNAVLLDLAVANEHDLGPLQLVHEQHPEMPIIVLTNVDDEALAMRALQAGAQDSLVKAQLDGHLLVRAIRYAIERQQLHAALREMSLIDPATRLYNRRGLITLARQLFKVADRMRKKTSLIFVDLDGLKTINDTYGHRIGDDALLETTELLKETFRDSDIMARVGGDEFVVLAMENAGADAEMWTARLQEKISGRNARNDRRYVLSLSIGIAYYDPDAPRELDEILARADRLMYEEKRAKRNSPVYGVMLPTPSQPFPATLGTRAD